MSLCSSNLELNDIVPNRYYPRKTFDPEKLEGLKQSISEYGLTVPIKVRPINGDRYELVYGERRLKAFQELGEKTIPCIIEDMDDRNAIISAGIENITRGSLNYLEEGGYYHNLLEQGILRTQKELADTFGVSRRDVGYKLRVFTCLGNIAKINGNNGTGNGNIALDLIPLTHALELTRLHPDNLIVVEEKMSDGTIIKKKIRNVIDEVVQDEELNREYLTRFSDSCIESQRLRIEKEVR